MRYGARPTRPRHTPLLHPPLLPPLPPPIATSCHPNPHSRVHRQTQTRNPVMSPSRIVYQEPGGPSASGRARRLHRGPRIFNLVRSEAPRCQSPQPFPPLEAKAVAMRPSRLPIVLCEEPLLAIHSFIPDVNVNANRDGLVISQKILYPPQYPC